MTNRIAMVTAANGGLGQAVVHQLLRQGLTVIAASKSFDTELTQQTSTIHGPLYQTHIDLEKSTSITETVDLIIDQLGPPTILVNITGGPEPMKVQEVDEKMLKLAFKQVLRPPVLLANALLPYMEEEQWGRIVTCTSSGAVSPIPQLVLSNMFRAGLHAWSKTLSNEVAAAGITANIVIPGRIHTPRVDALDKKRADSYQVDTAEIVQKSISQIPAGRYGTPSEFASVVGFLVTDAASYMTGEAIRVDGGYTNIA